MAFRLGVSRYGTTTKCIIPRYQRHLISIHFPTNSFVIPLLQPSPTNKKTFTTRTSQNTRTRRSTFPSKPFFSRSHSTSSFSSSLSPPSLPPPSLPENTRIQIIGSRNDFDAVKRYLLVRIPTSDPTPPTTTTQSSSSSSSTDTTTTTINEPIPIASLYLKRNILFGTNLHDQSLPYRDTCRHLVEAAILDASQHGDQPQGIANLSGLSSYIRTHLNRLDEQNTTTTTTTNNNNNTINDVVISPVLLGLHQRMKMSSSSSSNEDNNNNNDDSGRVVYDAVRSIATQIPRKGHSVVGYGTYRDGREGWTDLAREYAGLGLEEEDEDGGSGGGSRESGLFLACGGVISSIEYNGDADVEYLKKAGGAMARFFFL